MTDVRAGQGAPPAMPIARGGSIFPGWQEPTNLKWKRNPHPLLGAERWARIYDSPLERIRVIVAWEVANGWHLSISHPTRYPTWDEIKTARYELLPDEVTMGMLLPPSAEYVNVHPNCFHLHEVTP